MKKGLEQLGLELMPSDTAIQPVMVGSAEDAVVLSNALLEKNILVSAIRPPTVPEGTARLRITLSATHTEEDVAELINALSDILEKKGNPA